MPDIDLILGADPGRRRAIRTEPTQRRSTQRLDALLDAAAELVDEVGFDRLTTQMVAERAGASIGTVYRYFPDRVAILQGLRDRCVARFRAQVAARLEHVRPDSWWDLVEAALDASADLYREEPGFGVVHAADRELAQDAPEPEFASRMANLIVAEFGEAADVAELRFRLGVALEIGDALTFRAYGRDQDGDGRYLAEAKSVVRGYLAEHLDASIRPRAAA